MEDKEMRNPLDDLFTDSVGQIDPTDLAAVLRPYLRINRTTNNVIFTPSGMKLTANNKIILFILSKKALFIKKILSLESVAPKDIKRELGKNIPSGTIDVVLKRLSDKGLIKNEGNGYFVPDFNFQEIKEMFTKMSKE